MAGQLDPPPEIKPSNRKTHSGNYKSTFVNKIGPYICLISKSAPIYQVTLELLPLYRAGKKEEKKTDMERQYYTHSN